MCGLCEARNTFKLKLDTLGPRKVQFLAELHANIYNTTFKRESVLYLAGAASAPSSLSFFNLAKVDLAARAGGVLKYHCCHFFPYLTCQAPPATVFLQALHLQIPMATLLTDF